jgi:hypothetical protein
MTAQEIRDLFRKHNVYLSRDDVWEVHGGTPVIKHQALERLSSTLKISWSQPVILRSERDEAVIIVTGNLIGGASEWSIGEAVIGQNYIIKGKMQAYPYAMAEKRAKDRVILKLAGLYGSYSEEESQTFKEERVEEEPQQVGSYEQGLPPVPMPVPPTNDSRSIYVNNSIALIEQIQTPDAVSAWLDREVEKGVWKQYGISEHHDDGKAILIACKKRRLELKQKDAA